VLKLKKFNRAEAVDLLTDYSIFRREELGRFVDPQRVIQEQIQSKKAFWMSHDKTGRPCIVIRPRLHTPHKNNHTLLYSMVMFEYICELVWRTKSYKNLCVILDFEGFGTKNFDFQFARTFISWSRKYFKNLLGACFCVKSPKYALWCWNLVKIFVPAETLKKVHICKKDEWQKVLLEHFDASCLLSEFGGTLKTPWSPTSRRSLDERIQSLYNLAP